MQNLPTYIGIVFGLTTLATVLIFYKSTANSKTTLLVLCSWLALQAFISLSGFYTVTNSLPPRLLFSVIPAMLFIVVLFVTAKGRQFIDSLDTKVLTLLHIIRIPVEMVLFWLFVHKTVPQIMTFEGRNFDILSGITSPIVYYFGFVKRQLSRKVIILWNFICLGLLANIVVIALLSAPFPFQQLAFEQPNIAILYFPFIWLPCCVVPLVLLAHLVCIRHIINNKNTCKVKKTADTNE